MTSYFELNLLFIFPLGSLLLGSIYLLKGDVQFARYAMIITLLIFISILLTRIAIALERIERGKHDKI